MQRINTNNSDNHTSSVDTKLLNELLQLLRKQALSSGVQLKNRRKNVEAEESQGLVLTFSFLTNFMCS